MHAALHHIGSPLPRRKLLGQGPWRRPARHGARCSATPVSTKQRRIALSSLWPCRAALYSRCGCRPAARAAA